MLPFECKNNNAGDPYNGQNMAMKEKVNIKNKQNTKLLVTNKIWAWGRKYQKEIFP